MLIRRSVLVAAAASVLMVPFARADDFTWTGNSSNAWGTPNNWNLNSGVPNGATDTATFSGNKNTSIMLGTDRSLAALTFGSGASAAFSLSGNTINLASGGTITKAADSVGRYEDTISSNIAIGSSATFANNDPDGSGPDYRRLTISGGLSGNGTLHITSTGAGAINLTGDNSNFTGAISLDSGILIVNSANALGSTSAATTVNGGEVWFTPAGSTAENWIIAGNTRWASYLNHTQSGTVTVNPNVIWTINNGGGNALELSNVISGQGNINFEYANTTFSGSSSNTLSGKITQAATSSNDTFDTLFLNKSGGATAIAGDLEVDNQGIVQWSQSNQIADSSNLTLGGGTLALNGHTDTVSTLTLTGKASIDLSGGANTLHFADSHSQSWSAGGQLLLRNWSGVGTDDVFVGANGSALTAAQVAKIGFVNPNGSAAGLYHATINSAGELTPGTQVQAVNPPFDLSAPAVAARTAKYNIDGRGHLASLSTTILPANTSISIFGDSITWLNGYIPKINTALAGRNVQIHNRGINGAGVADVKNGTANTAITFDGNPQAGFASVIGADHSKVAVVYIGINDVVFLNTTQSAFESGLRSLAASAAANNTKLVLATLSVHYEYPDGSNTDDAKLDAFAQITRNVAADTGATLVDLRSAYIAYEQNNNYELNLDGSLSYPHQSGLLTGDGIHPTDLGNNLLADLISQGIYQSLTVPEPAVAMLGLVGVAGLLRQPGRIRKSRA